MRAAARVFDFFHARALDFLLLIFVKLLFVFCRSNEFGNRIIHREKCEVHTEKYT